MYIYCNNDQNIASILGNKLLGTYIQHEQVPKRNL